ncbi:unnamed protein product [Schistosoma rodhaini]|uniref:Uncharacterized protein n=1 Tax=Schistosoma rodhaini TaxID=6188 RepID=A0AA85F509_9TREM|nr:unnamed protein product [Schistosoma rodhaini]
MKFRFQPNWTGQQSVPTILKELIIRRNIDNGHYSVIDQFYGVVLEVVWVTISEVIRQTVLKINGASQKARIPEPKFRANRILATRLYQWFLDVT